ncbi:unnamed protein product [Prunus armeniaca]
MRRCLERQERETNERRRRRVEGKRVQREEDQQVDIALALLDKENQGRHRGSQVCHGPNVDRHRHSRVMYDICNYDAYFVQKCDVAGLLGLLPKQKLTVVIRILAYGLSTDQVDEIARMGKSTTLESLVRFFYAVETLYTKDYLPANLHPRTSNGFYKKQKLEDFQE